MAKPPVEHRRKELALQAEHAERNAETEAVRNRMLKSRGLHQRQQQGSGGPMAPALNEAKALGTSPNKMAQDPDLEGKTVDELAAIAAARGITVARTDGKKGKLRKGDYLTALA